MINRTFVLFLSIILLNVSSFAFTDSTYIAQFNISIQNAEDDMEERFDGTMYNGSTDIELAEDQDQVNGIQTVGIRFQNIPVPQGAIIQEAYLQFTVDEYSAGNCDLVLRGEASDNANPYSTSAFQNISTRLLTNTSVAWSPLAWINVDESDQFQRSPNLSSFVQEVINRPGWQEGQALSIIINGSGTRVARAYETNPQQAAKLILKVELPVEENPISNLFINELMPSNGLITDEFNEADDWIELYNGNTVSDHLGGLYLSDDENELDKWQISAPVDLAPNEFAMIWADGSPDQGGLHANFKLKSEGETIFLSQYQNGNLVILDQITYPETPLNLSYGRKQDGLNEWITFGEATPKLSNNESGFFMDRVTFSLASGVYQGSQTLSILGPIPGTEIRYTTDGSIPDQTSFLFTTPITVGGTSTIRAKAFKNEYAPSKLATVNYIINSNHDLPIFSITTTPDNLWSNENGIYVIGTNGVSGWCREDPANWNQDWERPATIAMFEEDGSLAFQKEIGIKIGGGCSRTQSQKSFNIYVRKNTYGDEEIEHEIFPGHPVSKFKRFKLRDGGQDFGSMMMRDGLNQSLLVDQVDIDLMAYRPAAVYLNGQYWGLYGIREFYTKHHLINHYDVEEGNIDMLVNPFFSWGNIKEGDKVAFNALYSYIQNNNLSNPGAFEYVNTQIDMEEFLNYNIVQVYLANYDWPANNTIAWKPRDGGKWRWMLFDTDASTSFPLWGETHSSFNSIAFATSSTSTDWPNHRNSTLFLRKLLENTGFKNEYIQRTCTFSETIYSDDRINHFTDSISAIIETEMPRQIQKWGEWNDYGWGITAHGNINEWRNDLASYKNFFSQRRLHLRNHFKSYFNLGDRGDLTINHDTESGGEVYFHSNEMRIPYQYSGEYFYDIPIKIKAVADPGYTFIKWEETGNTNPEIDFSFNEPTTLTPIFVKDGFVFVTEIHFAPEGGEDYEYIEIINPVSTPLFIGNYTISGAIDFTFPTGTQIEGNGYLLIVKNKDHFDETNCAVFEWTDGNLDNSEGLISIKNTIGQTVNEVTYNATFPYLEEARLTGKSLHLLDIALDNTVGQNWLALAPTLCDKGIDYLPYEEEDYLFEIYPNPASGQINIRYAQNNSESLELSIFNSVGQLVRKENLRAEPYEKTEILSINGLAAGMYIFKINQGENSTLEKVIVQ